MKAYAPEVKERALELLNQGTPPDLVALRVSVSRTTLRRWSDPAYQTKNNEQNMLRRRKLRKPCVICGRLMGYENTAGFCVRCTNASRSRKWTRDSIIAAMQRWNDEYGLPPSSKDWNHRLRPSWCPSINSVYGPSSPFGSWAEAVEAAGFPRPYSGTRYPKAVKTRKRHQEAVNAKYPPEWILSEIRRLSSWGKAPSTSDERDLYKRATAQFGSWETACKEAGVTPRGKKLYA